MSARALGTARSPLRASHSPARPLWIVSELFYPEETSTSHYLTRLARSAARRFDVRVLCGDPRYDLRGETVPPRERDHGVEIRRCRGTTLNKNVPVYRAINALTLMLSIGWAAFRNIRRGDIVMGVTNPPTMPPLLALVCVIRRAKFVLLVHDVYPDAAIAAGLLRPNSVVARAWRRLNRCVFARSARIIVIGRDMAELIGGRLPVADHGRIHVIPNWADVDEVVPTPRAASTLLRKLGLSAKFVVQYAGNMGAVHDVELLLDAARDLARRAPDVHFVFVGAGKKRDLLERATATGAFPNVTVLDWCPRARQNEFLNACDVAIMTFIPGMAGVGVPSRLYNVMASGRPLIAVMDEDSEVARVVREEGIGWTVQPGDTDGFVEAVVAARAQSDCLSAMGGRGRAAAETTYAFDTILHAYMRLLDALDGD